MSEPITPASNDALPQAAIDAASMISAEPATKGAASRFDALSKEKGIEVHEQGISLKQQEDWQSTPEEEKTTPAPSQEQEKASEKKTEVEKPAKDAIPEFGKKPEPKTEVKEPNYDEELKAHPAIKGEAAKSFKTVLQQRDEAKKTLESKQSEYEAKIKELESRPQTAANDEKIKALEEKSRQLEETLGRVNYANSPKIRALNEHEKNQIAAAKSFLDGDDAQQAAVETAANLTGKKRLQALVDSGMGTEAIAAVAANLSRVDEIRMQRNAELENWKQSAEQWEQEQKTQQMQADAKRKDYEENVFKTVLDTMSSKLEGLQKVDGYEDWNKGVEDRTANIKRLYNGQADLPEIAEVIAKGVAYDAKDRLYNNLQKKYDLLAEENGKLKGAVTPKGDVKPGADKSVQEQGSVASRFDATKASIQG